MNISNKPLTVVFFTPHADDIELGVPFMYIEALKLGNKVIEVVMTDNEFGTHFDDFKEFD
jgi:LmbE family N-acetylglucosaminyl deacetylase